jgi:hypothetical protein
VNRDVWVTADAYLSDKIRDKLPGRLIRVISPM